LDFANASNNCTTFAGTSMLHCPQIGTGKYTFGFSFGHWQSIYALCLMVLNIHHLLDIQTCQSKGKKILLSLGKCPIRWYASKF
jgi:hypothetical protein